MLQGRDPSSARVSAVKTPAVSFVIPVRNDAAGLERCLRSILADQPPGATDIVVVDNGSEDDSVDVAVRLGARVLCLPGVRVSELRNQGVARTRGAFVAFVDADHELAEGWIDAAVSRLEQPGVAAVGAPYHAPSDPTWVQRMYDRLRVHRREAAEAGWLPSGNLVVFREAFDAIGGFDATLETCEDVDFCSRLRRAGYRLVNDPAMFSAHWGDPPSLAALLRGELWRGRDNVRVTLASDRSWRSLVSLAFPAANLVALASVLVGLVTRSPIAASAGITVLVTIPALYTLRMVRADRFTLRSTAQAFAVAFVYHIARALALIWPARHRRAHLPRVRGIGSSR